MKVELRKRGGISLVESPAIEIEMSSLDKDEAEKLEALISGLLTDEDSLESSSVACDSMSFTVVIHGDQLVEITQPDVSMSKRFCSVVDFIERMNQKPN